MNNRQQFADHHGGCAPYFETLNLVKRSVDEGAFDFNTVFADDAFVRSLFTPAERRRGEADYSWPLSEGFRDLVRVRRRQDAGVKEQARFQPDFAPGSDRPDRRELRKLALADPAGFAVYAAVALATRLSGADEHWARRRS